MISPHTPSGTWVVLTKIISTSADVRQVIKPQYWPFIVIGNAPAGFEIGAKFQVAQIVPSELAKCGFLVCMTSFLPNQGSFLEMYSIAELPESLTNLLIPTKVPENA